jgi:hypothetical protein
MKLYKSYQFKDIREVEAHSFTDKTFSYWLSTKHPTKYRIANDWLITTERFGCRGNYFETFEEAIQFTQNELQEKIKKLELDLIKYNKRLKQLK